MATLTNADPDKRKEPMAAVATQTISAHPLPDFTHSIEQTAFPRPNENDVKFDPKKHLAYDIPSSILMMKDIGYADDTGVSPMGVCYPFQLFTPAAIEAMRAEIFKPEVQRKYKYSSNIAACQLRGYAKESAPFTWEAWNHPETLAVISKIAGVELVPALDYEVGHINFSVKTEAEAQEELKLVNERKQWHAKDDGIGNCPWEGDKPIVGWHTDSYPFVCVLMMSDCANMVGGETAIRCADGKIIRVRGPTQGCAVILQGRYITHQALRAVGTQERISSVTSFRPKSPFLKDDTELRTVRPVSDLSELYYDFAEYRLKIMEERIRRERQEIEGHRKAGKQFDVLRHKRFLENSVVFMKQTDHELVNESEVKKGFIDTIDLPDVVIDSKKMTDTSGRASAGSHGFEMCLL